MAFQVPLDVPPFSVQQNSHDGQMFPLAQIIFGKTLRSLVAHSARAALLAITGHALPVDAEEARRSVQDSAIDLSIKNPHKTPTPSWDYVSVFFVTNRKLNEDAGDPSIKGIQDAFDDYYSNESDISVSLGQACVAYPHNRQVADQDYPSETDVETPTRHFVVKIPIPITSTRDFESAIANGGVPFYSRICPVDNLGSFANPIIYFHGFATTFTAAITRGSQLKVDLDRKTMIVVTWPSDKLGLEAYREAENEEKAAVKLVPFSTGVTRDAFKQPPNVIAHSMGARLYADGMTLMAPLNSSQKTRVAIFAAPDVDHDTFNKQFSSFQVWNRSTTVYCAEDRALVISGIMHWDRRLGYCKVDDPTPAMPEEFVRVSGKFTDTWRHSYFLSAPEMIYDMKSVLSKGEVGGDNSGGREFPPRTLELR